MEYKTKPDIKTEKVPKFVFLQQRLFEKKFEFTKTSKVFEISDGQLIIIKLLFLSYLLGIKKQKFLHLLILFGTPIATQKSFLICTLWRKKHKRIINQLELLKLNLVKVWRSMLEIKLKASLTGLYSHKRAIAEILKNERKLQVETYFLVEKLLNAIKDKITLFLFFFYFVYKAYVLLWHLFQTLFFCFL